MSGSKGGEKLDYDGKEDIEFTVTDDVEVMPTFDVMGLREDLLRSKLRSPRDLRLRCCAGLKSFGTRIGKQTPIFRAEPTQFKKATKYKKANKESSSKE